MKNLIILIMMFSFGNIFSQAQTLSIPNVTGASGSTITVPINAQNLDMLAAGDLEVRFDSNILSFIGAEAGNISSGALVESNEISPGLALIGFVHGLGISDEGELIILNFKINGTEGESTTLDISGEFYDIEPIDIMMITNSGQLSIEGTAISWMKYLPYILGGLLVFGLLLLLLFKRKKKTVKEPSSMQVQETKNTYSENPSDTSYISSNEEEAVLLRQLQKLRERKKLENEEAELERRLRELRDKKRDS